MNNNIELFIGNPVVADLDLDNGFDVALQYSIADIKDISKRNSAYSKTIVLPGTKNNNYWLGNLFDINADFSQFNPNKKTPAKVLVNSEIVLNGFLQLRKIKKLVNVDHQGNKIQYEVVLYDNAVDLMTELGEKEINVLDLSEFEHTYDRARIIASWSHTWEDGYVYPMYGTRDKPNVYSVEQFYPAVFYKAILNKILQEAGYGWKGSLATNAQFEKEIIAYTGDKTPKISQTELERRKFRAGITDPYLIPLTGQTGTSAAATIMFDNTMPFNDTTTSPNFDNGPTFDITQNEWVADRNGKFSFQYSVNYSITITNNFGVQAIVVLPNGIDFQHTLEVYENGAWVTWPGSTLILNYAVPGNNTSIQPGASITINASGSHATNERQIYAGQKVRARMVVTKGQGAFYTSSLSVQNLPVTLNFTNTPQNSLIITPLNGNISQGDTIDFASVISDKIKQKDLISDLIKRYNLFIQVDPDNPNLLIFDSRTDFYEAGDVLDWTTKKDYSSEDNIELLSELQFKSLLYSYKPDNDVENAYYTSVTGDVYGQYKWTFDNDFVKGEKKIESIFSPTPLIRTTFNAIVPSLDPDEPKGNPRVLYWSGLKPCNDWIFTQYILVLGVPVPIPQTMTGGYPYAGHLDDPFNPDLDINFGTFKFPMYSGLNTMTNNNMFNQYWFNYTDQISEGRLVTSKFYLTEADIRYIKNNFNARIFILDSYYYINKIKDYKPLNNGVTEVELLKIKDGVRWKQTSFVYVGTNPVDILFNAGVVAGSGNAGGFSGVNIGNGNIGGGVVVGENGSTNIISQIAVGNNNEMIGNGLAVGDNNITSNKSAIIGSNNKTLVESSLVLGGFNNNLLKSGLVLRGDDNVINAENISLISSFGITASVDNSVYLGNKVRAGIYDGRIDSVDIKFEGRTKAFNGILETIDNVNELVVADGRDTLTYNEGNNKWEPSKKIFTNYFEYEGSSVTVLTQNVWEPLAMNATLGFTSDVKLLVNADGVVQWLGVDTIIFKIEAIISGSSGNNNEIHAAFFLNGAIWPCSEQSIVTSSGGKASSLAIQCLVELKPTDVLQIYVKNSTATTDFVLRDVNSIISEL